MKKELIICGFVVIFIIIGNIITQNNTKKCVETMNKELIELKTNIVKDKNEIENKTKDVKKTWEDMQEILGFYIEHDELEKVQTQLFLIRGDIETKLYDEVIPEIEKCIFILNHIEDKTALKIQNIF